MLTLTKFLTKFAVAAVSLVATMAVPSGASAEHVTCGSRPEMLQQLSDEYQEASVAIGVASNGGVLEVLSSSTGGTWTILVTMPNGISCMVAAGDSWQTLPQQTAQPGGQFGPSGISH